MVILLRSNIVFIQEDVTWVEKYKTQDIRMMQHQFRDILIIRLPDHMKDMLQRIGKELSSCSGCIYF